MGGVTIDESAFEDSTVLTRSIGGGALGPLKVLVLARSGKLVRKLEVALGPENIGAAAARDEGALSRLEGVLSPDVVIVDGQNAADVSPNALADVLVDNPERMILIWCADQPAGSAVKNALEARNVDFVAIPRSAGVDPLIDYLRARMSGS
jgi:chemotaxis response regulator CheB